MAKSKQKISSLNLDCRLYSNLYIASQSRDGSLDEFFKHENHSYPVSISEYRKLRKGTAKSDFVKCLEELLEPVYESPAVEMKVIDGAAFINIHQPRSSQTIGEYCFDEIKEKVCRLTNQIQRLDFVFDVYKEKNIKAQTR